MFFYAFLVRPWMARRLRDRTIQAMLKNAHNWQLIWSYGGVVVVLRDNPRIGVVSPAGNWRSFARRFQSGGQNRGPGWACPASAGAERGPRSGLTGSGPEQAAAPVRHGPLAWHDRSRRAIKGGSVSQTPRDTILNGIRAALRRGPLAPSGRRHRRCPPGGARGGQVVPAIAQGATARPWSSAS